jgi:hypothetical protein
VQIEVKMRREIENRKTTFCAARCTKLIPGFAINTTVKNLCEHKKAPERKVVTISSQPGGRNSGKNGGKFCFKMKHAHRKRMRK